MRAKVRTLAIACDRPQSRAVDILPVLVIAHPDFTGIVSDTNTLQLWVVSFQYLKDLRRSEVFLGQVQGLEQLLGFCEILLRSFERSATAVLFPLALEEEFTGLHAHVFSDDPRIDRADAVAATVSGMHLHGFAPVLALFGPEGLRPQAMDNPAEGIAPAALEGILWFDRVTRGGSCLFFAEPGGVGEGEYVIINRKVGDLAQAGVSLTVPVPVIVGCQGIGSRHDAFLGLRRGGGDEDKDEEEAGENAHTGALCGFRNR